MKVFQITLALLSLVALIECVKKGVVFTGHADVDFNPSNPSFASYQVGAIGAFQSIIDFTPPQYMIDRNRTDGMDVKWVRTFYDYEEDALYVGIQCSGICGDTDGNGNPSTIDPGTAQFVGGDDPNGCTSETYSLLWWNNVPSDYAPQDGNPGYFFPTFMTGDSLTDCIVDADGTQHFLAYEFPNYKDVMWPVPRDEPFGDAVQNQQIAVANPAGAPGVVSSSYDNSLIINSLFPSIPKLEMYTQYVNASKPHIEFVLRNFSKYPENEYLTPGSGIFKTGISGSFFSNIDVPGEDSLYPQVWIFGYDCAHVAGGSSVYDVCGVCGGDSSSCADCAGTPNGNATYDACGVCNGDATSCQCNNYLGFDLEAVDYALLRWTVGASLVKINDTLSVLKSIKKSLQHYDYEHGDVSLNDYIDVIHEFCDNCLDSFDDAQMWFTEVLSGACDGLNCDSPFDTQVRWSL